MITGPDFVREMHSGEENAIDALLSSAFGSNEEAQLVQLLRKSTAIAGESVLPWEGQVVGYFALSYMVKPKGWLCLAPVAISPEWQNMGHGKRMIGLLSEWAKKAGVTVVVLGDADFYEKAGFSLSRAANLISPYPIEHTLLAGGDDSAPNNTLVYPAAFDAL